MKPLAFHTFLTLLFLPVAWARPRPRATLPTKDELFVDGKKIPGVSIEAPDMYSGMLPIDEKDPDRSLFFMYAPLDEGAKTGDNDLVIWFNGGPGCSSLFGFFLENIGPITFLPGSTKVINAARNPHSWTQFAHVLVVDQPIGTGFSPGKVKISNQQELAKEFYGFLESFFKVFPELKTARISLAGESYASRYVAHIADLILREKEFEMGSLIIADGDIVAEAWSEDVPAYKAALEHQRVLGLNSTAMDDIKSRAEESGSLPAFLDSILSYPQIKPLLLPAEYDPQEQTWDALIYAATQVNSCFTWYDYTQKCPRPIDPLGFDYGNISSDNVFNNVPGLKAALHAPDISFLDCSPKDSFKKGTDTTPPLAEDPTWSNVVDTITRTNRVVIWHGMKDFIIFPVASELGVQNTTWQGEQGLKVKPYAPLNVGGARVGTIATERGLTLAFVDDCGHNCPADKPEVTFDLMRHALGQISV